MELVIVLIVIIIIQYLIICHKDNTIECLKDKIDYIVYGGNNGKK